MTTSNLFSGLRNAKTFERGVWLQEGLYQVRINRAVFKKTRAKGDAFILEFKIERSNYEEAKQRALKGLEGQKFDLQELEKILPNAPGSSASWYQSLQDPDIGFGALKGFAASILDQKPEDPEFLDAVEGFMDSVVNEGAINGMLIPVETVIVQTKKNEDFTLHKWGKIIEE